MNPYQATETCQCGATTSVEAFTIAGLGDLLAGFRAAHVECKKRHDPLDFPESQNVRLPVPDDELEPQRLYGTPGAEVMHDDIAGVYESDIEPWMDLVGSVEVEEWSVLPAIAHAPSVDTVIEFIAEWVGDNGELANEYGYDAWANACKTPEVVAAAQALLEVVASTVKWRQADKHLCSHEITWDDKGEPLVDGLPMYVAKEATPQVPQKSPSNFDKELDDL